MSKTSTLFNENHSCLKPQHFMRIIVRALLPLGTGAILDPFMGSGSQTRDSVTGDEKHQGHISKPKPVK